MLHTRLIGWQHKHMTFCYLPLLVKSWINHSYAQRWRASMGKAQKFPLNQPQKLGTISFKILRIPHKKELKCSKCAINNYLKTKDIEFAYDLSLKFTYLDFYFYLGFYILLLGKNRYLLCNRVEIATNYKRMKTERLLYTWHVIYDLFWNISSFMFIVFSLY